MFFALDSICHPNLGAMQYGAFFNLCRLHGIAFDLKERSGTAFALSDSLAGGILGLLGIAGTRRGALRAVVKSLSFIESQVGSMHQMTEFEEERSNFMDVMRAVKAISKSMEGAKNGDKDAAGNKK